MDGITHYDLKTGKSASWTGDAGRPLRRADLRAAPRRCRRRRRLGADRGLSRQRGPQRPRGVRGDRHCQGTGGAGTSQQQGARGLPRQLEAGPTLEGDRHDHRPSPRELAIAARPVDAGGAWPRLRDQALQARAHHAGAGSAARRASARQVAGDHRRRQDTGRIRRHPRIPGRDLRQGPVRAVGRFAGAAALHLLHALRRRLADAASVHEAGVQPPARARAVGDAAGGAHDLQRRRQGAARPADRQPLRLPRERARASANGSPAPISRRPTSR